MKAHTIIFSADGRARCLWTEEFPLAELGLLEVRRAGAVEFNNRTQEWEARLAANPDAVAFSHPSREACLNWERETLDERL